MKGLGRVIFLPVLTLLFLTSSSFEEEARIGEKKNQFTLEKRYRQGIRTYHAKTLLAVVEETKSDTRLEVRLLRGRCLIGLQFIDYLKGNLSRSFEWGKEASRELEKALEMRPDSVDALGEITLLFQNLAVIKGIKYGPKSGAFLKRLKKQSPSGYYTDLARARQYLNAPVSLAETAIRLWVYF